MRKWLWDLFLQETFGIIPKLDQTTAAERKKLMEALTLLVYASPRSLDDLRELLAGLGETGGTFMMTLNAMRQDAAAFWANNPHTAMPEHDVEDDDGLDDMSIFWPLTTLALLMQKMQGLIPQIWDPNVWPHVADAANGKMNLRKHAFAPASTDELFRRWAGLDLAEEGHTVIDIDTTEDPRTHSSALHWCDHPGMGGGRRQGLRLSTDEEEPRE